MSERIRHTVLASLAGSKRIIVAACAAIAMFLGAVSAGASVFVYDNPSSRSTDMSAVFNPTSVEESKNNSPAKDTSTDNFSRQDIFPDERITPNTALYTTQPVTQTKSTATKKNPVVEVLRSATNSGIFQAQADLLDKLQGKANDTLDGVTAPVDITGINLPNSSVPIIAEPTTDNEQITLPSDTQTPPVEDSGSTTANSYSVPPIINPEN